MTRPSVAEAAEPLSQPSQVAKMMVSTTPDTYSGVDVVAIDRIESARSVRDPSRMPATTPIASAAGIMTMSTQNMRIAVASSAGPSLSMTLTLNLVEQPRSPWSTPENLGAFGSSQNEKRGVATHVTEFKATPGQTSNSKKVGRPSASMRKSIEKQSLRPTRRASSAECRGSLSSARRDRSSSCLAQVDHVAG